MRGIRAEATAPPEDSQGPPEARAMSSKTASPHELLHLARTAAERAAAYPRSVARPAPPEGSQGPPRPRAMPPNPAPPHELLHLARPAAERAAAYLRSVARPA